MAKNNIKKLWFEDFRLGRVKKKNRYWASNEPTSHKGSFFGKTGKGGWFGHKAGKKTDYGPKNWEQRSIAKVSYVKNIYPGQWRVQGRYLARQGAQVADQLGLGINEKDNDLNIAQILGRWQENGDPRLWKVIISPEMAHKLDLKEHVRAVMGKVQEDLGTKLEWLAIDHHNTDNPHAHIVFRGVDRNGQELRIKQEYFTQGFRLRSAQEATRVLGFRLEQDILLKREHNIRSLHVTEMDREIERRLTKDHFINLTSASKNSFAYEKQLQLKSRLMFLEEKGLAKRDSSVSWMVEPGFIDCLKFIQTQHDVVKAKNKHIQNLSNPNLPVIVNKFEKVGDMIIGRIVGMGFDEFRSDSRYMLIEGIDNRIHYVPASVGMSHKRDDGDLRNGEIIFLERKEFIKEREGQEPQKIKYLFTESYGSFSDLRQSQRLTNVDLFILNQFQETKRVPGHDIWDGEVRKQFLELMKNRIELMQRVNIIFDDGNIHQAKLDWTLENNLMLKQGPRLSLRLERD